MMTQTRLLLCSLCLLVRAAHGADTPTPPPASAQASPTESTMKSPRLFAAHHSYFLAIPPILTDMAKAGGFTGQVFVGTHMIGGSKSLQHWVIKDEDNQAKQSLAAGTVDVLILTPVYLPDEGVEDFARFGLEHNPDLRVTVQEFWLPFDEYQPHYYDPPKIPTPKMVDHNAQTVAGLRQMHERYFNEMDALVRDVNGKLGKQAVFVVPAGQAVIALREKIIAGQAPGLKNQQDLFSDALGHPTPVLQVLIAYAHYAVIYRQNPAGLPVPEALRKLKLAPDETGALNGLLQNLAWEAALHHPLSGVE